MVSANEEPAYVLNLWVCVTLGDRVFSQSTVAPISTLFDFGDSLSLSLPYICGKVPQTQNARGWLRRLSNESEFRMYLHMYVCTNI